MSHPTLIRTRHKLFALARKGMCQGDIAAKIGVARKNVNRILLRQVASASQEPGKSTAAIRKTTARQECALFRMVREDRFKSARALTERMRNLYGVRVGRRTINNQLVARGYRACRIPRKPLVTANHHRLRLDWSQQNLTVAAWSHVIWGDEWRFQLYPVYGHMRVRRLPGERFQQGCQGPSWRGFCPCLGAFHSGAKSPLVFLDRNVNGVVYRDIVWVNMVPFARQHFGDNFCCYALSFYGSYWLSVARGHHLNGPACTICYKLQICYKSYLLQYKWWIVQDFSMVKSKQIIT